MRIHRFPIHCAFARGWRSSWVVRRAIRRRCIATLLPITYLRPQLPPTLQIHGVHDCIVKVRFARSLHQGLLRQGNRSLLLEIPWSDHAFDFVYFGAGNALALPYVEAFLNATVGERP